MSTHRIAWLQIHFCVFLWGFTAIIGRLITLPAMTLVLWRMLLVAMVLLSLPRVWRGLVRLPPRYLLAFSGVGALVALHWISFYGAVKLANASVAATCMATLPIFMCVIEPLVTGKRFAFRELLLGLLVLPGMVLVVGGTPVQMNAGIAVGVLSSLLAALFSACNKRLILRTDSLTATAIEMFSGCLTVLAVSLALSLFMQSMPASSAVLVTAEQLWMLPAGGDRLWLLTLALLCTLLPFMLSLKAMRHISAYATALAVNLEPVYAVILAALILDEQREVDATFYAGVLIILTAVMLYPRWSRNQPQQRVMNRALAREQLTQSD